MTLPLVSTIIPAHNGEKYLQECIISALEQDYLSHEIWVIDNASNDKTAEIVRSFPQVKYVFNSIANPTIARNLGAKHAQGQYLAFLDCDDIWPTQKISWQVDFLEKSNHHDAVIGMQQMFVDKGSKKPGWVKDCWLEVPQYAYIPSALMVKKEIFLYHKGFNEEMFISSDSDWFFRMKNAGVQLGILPETIVHRRIHGANTSNGVTMLQKELLLAIKESIHRERNV